MTIKFDLQTFEGLAKENGIRYWDARDFMASLGYDSWSSFKSVIKRAMGSCAHLDIGIDDCFIGKTILVDGKPLDTYKLTRFACLLVTMHADSKKPEVAQAKVALAAIAEALIEDSISTAALERIEIRTELKAGVTIMTDAAKHAGLQGAQDYAIFQDAGMRGMYNMSLADLIAHKGAPKDKTLFNYMGKTELAANLFRVTQTAERINNNKLRGLRRVAATASDVGVEVRQVMLKSSGVAPEDLSIEEDVKAVSQRIKTTQRKMTRLDTKQKPKRIAAPKPKKPASP